MMGFPSVWVRVSGIGAKPIADLAAFLEASSVPAVRLLYGFLTADFQPKIH
jgi:hypothetical protein